MKITYSFTYRFKFPFVVNRIHTPKMKFYTENMAI
jgi:hypothetical protein